MLLCSKKAQIWEKYHCPLTQVLIHTSQNCFPFEIPYHVFISAFSGIYLHLKLQLLGLQLFIQVAEGLRQTALFSEATHIFNIFHFTAHLYVFVTQKGTDEQHFQLWETSPGNKAIIAVHWFLSSKMYQRPLFACIWHNCYQDTKSVVKFFSIPFKQV